MSVLVFYWTVSDLLYNLSSTLQRQYVWQPSSPHYQFQSSAGKKLERRSFEKKHPI